MTPDRALADHEQNATCQQGAGHHPGKAYGDVRVNHATGATLTRLRAAPLRGLRGPPDIPNSSAVCFHVNSGAAVLPMPRCRNDHTTSYHGLQKGNVG